MTELDMPLNFSMKKLDSSDKMDENMNTLLNIEDGRRPEADQPNIGQLSIAEETEGKVNISSHSSSSASSFSADRWEYAGSLSSSTNHLLLVSKHPEIFRDLPAEEMAAVQQKLFELGTCQMECWKCCNVISYISGQFEDVARHVKDCWGSDISHDFCHQEIRSVFCEIEALADALVNHDADTSSEDESDEEFDETLELVKDELRKAKEMKSVFLCEPADNVFEGRTGLVLCLDPQDFLIDLHRSIEKIWFGPQELPATKFAECIILPAGRERMPYETELKDFLKERESAIYKYGSGYARTSVRITSIGCMDIALRQWNSKVMMSHLPLELVCSGCCSEMGNLILCSKANFRPLPLMISSEILFHPRSFCSLPCLEIYNNRTGQRIPRCALENVLDSPCFFPRGLMEDDINNSTDSSLNDSYSIPIGKRTKKFLGHFLKKSSGSLADRSGSSKDSCACDHCAESSCSTSFNTSSEPSTNCSTCSSSSTNSTSSCSSESSFSTPSTERSSRR